MQMRHAMTLIELIFAIIIMSIVVLSLPVMSQVIGKGAENNLVQEGILLASGNILKAISGQFDENSKDANITFEKILFTNLEDNDGNKSAGQRAGNISILFHDNNATRANVNGSDGGDKDDVDDYKTNGIAIDSVVEVGSAAGYKQQYLTDVNVTMENFRNAGSENTKKVVVLIQNEDGEDLVKMQTYTFNTGSVSDSPYRDLP